MPGFRLADLVRQHAAERPEAPALSCGATTLTFGELDTRSNRAAQALRALGVGPGDRVAVLDRNSPSFFEVAFGCSKLGAVVVGLNWRLAAPEVAEIAEDAGLAALVVGPEQLPLVPAGLACPVVVSGEPYDALLAAAEDVDPDADVSPDDVVLQLYSSGTTGRPKGAMLTSANLRLTVDMAATAWRMGPASVNLVASPLFHIGGAGYALTALSQGGHTVLVRDAAPALLLEEVARHGVTHAFWVPAVVQSVLDCKAVRDTDLSSLQLIGYGGAPMTEALLLRALDVLGCGFLGVYGMTETAGTVLVLEPEDHDPGGARAGLLRSVGRPLPWVELRVTDPLSGAPVAAGEVGEVLVRSDQTMAGYWKQPDVTAAALDAEGWLHTGDAAHVDEDGYVFLHDRLKDMIISGGENVFPAEVENALASHPSVGEVAVIAVPHERWGETVKAVVVARDGQQVDEQALIAHARERLARYKCPTSVDVVAALPRNASGKVLKKDLRAPYWSSAGAR